MKGYEIFVLPGDFEYKDLTERGEDEVKVIVTKVRNDLYIKAGVDEYIIPISDWDKVKEQMKKDNDLILGNDEYKYTVELWNRIVSKAEQALQ